MLQENILTLKNFRFFKWSLGLILICVGFYLSDSPQGQPGGGTWLGYTLGTISAILIIWLMCFGLRKRAYSANIGSVKMWLSAHVYLGLSLLVIATLHTGFQFGINIQTLTYILTVVVIFSGLWGVSLYLSKPAQLHSYLNGKTVDQCGEALLEIDRQSEKLASQLDASIQSIIKASSNTPIFAHAWQRYFGKNANCKTSIAAKKITAIYTSGERNNLIEELYILQLRRELQINQIRGYLRLKGWNEIWLVLHVSMSFGLLAALIAHIVSVFFYW
jgi:hypothetical protein